MPQLPPHQSTRASVDAAREGSTADAPSTSDGALTYSGRYSPNMYIPGEPTSLVPQENNPSRAQTAMQAGGSPPLAPSLPSSSRGVVRHTHRRARPDTVVPSTINESDEYESIQPTPAELAVFDETDRKHADSHSSYSHHELSADSETPLSALLSLSEEGRAPPTAKSSSYTLRPVSPLGDTHFSAASLAPPPLRVPPSEPAAVLSPPWHSSHLLSSVSANHIPRMTGLAAALPGTSIAQSYSTSEVAPGDHPFHGEHTITAHNDPPIVAATFPVKAATSSIDSPPTFHAEGPPAPDTDIPPIAVEKKRSISEHTSDVDGAFEVELEEHDELEDDEDHPHEDVPTNQKSPGKRLTAQVRESVIAQLACFEPIVRKIADGEKLQIHQVWDIVISYYTPKLHARDPTNTWNQYRSYFLEYILQELRRIYPDQSDEGE